MKYPILIADTVNSREAGQTLLIKEFKRLVQISRRRIDVSLDKKMLMNDFVYK